MESHTHVLLMYLASIMVAGALTYGAEGSQASGALALVRSGKEEERDQGRRLLLDERARIVQQLIDIIKSPRGKNDDGWLDATSARNVAIECVGEYRAAEAVTALTPLLEPAPGEIVVEDRAFRLCPAGRALVKIGQPSVPALIAILAASSDTKRMSASQARLVLYDIEGNDLGEAVFRRAVAAERDAAKRAAIEANMNEFHKEMAGH